MRQQLADANAWGLPPPLSRVAHVGARVKLGAFGRMDHLQPGQMEQLALHLRPMTRLGKRHQDLPRQDDLARPSIGGQPVLELDCLANGG
jgi:hypothetical protein